MSMRRSGSGISRFTVGSRKLSISSGSTPRPAKMRASNSGVPWRWTMDRARAEPRSSSRSRHAWPHTERSTLRKRRPEVFSAAGSAATMSAIESLSEELAILDETRPVRQLVVKRARDRVGLVREPVDPACAGCSCLALDCRDQGAPKTEIARILGDIKILQIAIIPDRPARAMKKIMNDTAQPSIDVGKPNGAHAGAA